MGAVPFFSLFLALFLTPFSYFGIGASFGLSTASGPSSWTNFKTLSGSLSEQSFRGYVIIKSVSAKIGGGVGASVISWVTGPAAGEEVPGIGLETGVALGTSATHGFMWRR